MSRVSDDRPHHVDYPSIEEWELRRALPEDAGEVAYRLLKMAQSPPGGWLTVSERQTLSRAIAILRGSA